LLTQTQSEIWGRLQFDYLLSGTPIIYAIESGRYSPITEAKAGVSIAPEDPKAIVDAVLSLKSLPRKKLNKLGDNGRQYAIKFHDYEKLANDFEKIMS
jgi:glycosyltransferase involved in cell wall biosynthesis